VSSLRAVPNFDETLHRFFQDSEILPREVGSVGYIGENRESFKKFFDEFGEKILKPTLLKLPPDEQVSTIIRNAVQKQTTLKP